MNDVLDKDATIHRLEARVTIQFMRSRNARLNLARRAATILATELDPGNRPESEDQWNALFAVIRDCAGDVHQGVHEASAYHNCLKALKEGDGNV